MAEISTAATEAAGRAMYGKDWLPAQETWQQLSRGITAAVDEVLAAQRRKIDEIVNTMRATVKPGDFLDGQVQMAELIAAKLGVADAPAGHDASLEPNTTGDGVRPLSTLRDTGLLWLINRQVLHPRGYALGLNFDDDGTVDGWVLYGDGIEPWNFPDGTENEHLAHVNALLTMEADHG